MSRQRAAIQRVRRLTVGLCDSVVDTLLLELYASFIFRGGRLTTRRAFGSSWDALQLLDAFNAKTIRRAVYRMRERGITTSVRNAVRDVRVTAIGRRWLAERFPVYHASRPWDGRMFLVTYDLPEQQRHLRQQLRTYLRQIRCALLQASVWVTPYNPRALLRAYVLQYHIPGVIVSSFERGSAIGEGSFRDLVVGAFDLIGLNDRYEQFLRKYRQRRDAHPREIAAAYLQILSVDPQLPFALLPEWWCGDEAHAFVVRCWRQCGERRQR